MEILLIYSIAFITALSGAMMPGPLLTVTIAQTAKKGIIAPILLMAGHSLLELSLVTGLWFGLGSVIKNHWILGGITIIGSLMLLYMGYGMIRDSSTAAIEINSTEKSDIKQKWINNPVISGIITSLSNPYWLIWWATIGLTLFGALSQNAFPIIAAFYFGHISGDILWYMMVGGAVVSGKKFLNPKIYTNVIKVCGTFLIILGISFLYLIASGDLWNIKMDMSSLQQKVDNININK